MRILDLTIKDVRGIRQEINLEPKGQNIVIYGPNGTGKSAVVDAIDFLFTGDMSRLAGRGSKGMTLKDHGKHIDANIKDAFVKATIAIDGVDDPIMIERRIEKPKDLICPEDIDYSLKKALKIAEKGQNVLSRSEILKYIAAEAGKRAEEIQAILNLNKVEDIRKAFVTISRGADSSKQADGSTFERSKAGVNAVLGIEEFSEDAVLNKVNEFRKTLKGEPTPELNPEKLKDGISAIAQDKKERVYPDQLKNTLAQANKIISEKGTEVFETEKKLRQAVKSLKEDEKLKRDLSNKRLLDIGISLIDESGSCPLCLAKWEPGKLEEFLKQRLTTAQEAAKIEKEIRDLATAVDNEASVLLGHIDTLAKNAKKLEMEGAEKDLSEWSKILGIWSKALRKAVDDYPIDEAPEKAKSFFAVDNWKNLHDDLEKAAKGLEKSSPEQKAWDGLTALEPVLKRYFDDKKKFEQSVAFADTARALSELYSTTKDTVLENLFKSVNSDFSEYYKYLHGEDEDGFESELKPDGSTLDFKVDFYGRGKHHPRALHSEGHQDSMGLCLYMALNKKISEGKVELVILDDVVMSIDAGHRRSVCKLLNKHFKELQFIITTHNRTWARQLCTDAVISRKNLVEFRGWSVETGPKYKVNLEVWDEIKQKVDDNEIASAAHQLREHLEFFFENVCDSLEGQVCYRTDGLWELGDYLKGAKGAYKDLLKMAKASANSWGNESLKAQLAEIETQVNEVIARTQSEHWGINENVHYNKWADFDKNDFLPIVEAFQDIVSFFVCSNCGGMIALQLRGTAKSNVKCPCGTFNWNLEMKKG